jgi:hypothetical protein
MREKWCDQNWTISGFTSVDKLFPYQSYDKLRRHSTRCIIRSINNLISNR